MQRDRMKTSQARAGYPGPILSATMLPWPMRPRRGPQLLTRRAAASGLVRQDLHVFDPDTVSWTDLSAIARGAPPSARAGHGLASAGGKLYVHAGDDGAGAAAVLSLPSYNNV